MSKFYNHAIPYLVIISTSILLHGNLCGYAQGLPDEKKYEPTLQLSDIRHQEQPLDLSYSMEKYKQQRENAKSIQLVGLLSIASGAILQNITVKNTSGDFIKSVYIGGGLFSFIGLAVDMGASRRLKIKRTKI